MLEYAYTYIHIMKLCSMKAAARQYKTHKTSASRGFTIVELLIVIVVIAILAALVIVSYNGIQLRAKDASVRNDMKLIAKDMELYRAENGSMPKNSSELGTIFSSPNSSIPAIKRAQPNHPEASGTPGYWSGALYKLVTNPSVPPGVDYNMIVAVEQSSDNFIIIMNTSFNGVYFMDKNKNISVNPFEWSTDLNTLLKTNAGLTSPIYYSRHVL